MILRLNFASCEELKNHGVDVPAYYKIGGQLIYCPGWSKFMAIFKFWFAWLNTHLCHQLSCLNLDFRSLRKLQK